VRISANVPRRRPRRWIVCR